MLGVTSTQNIAGEKAAWGTLEVAVPTPYSQASVCVRWQLRPLREGARVIQAPATGQRAAAWLFQHRHLQAVGEQHSAASCIPPWRAHHFYLVCNILWSLQNASAGALLRRSAHSYRSLIGCFAGAGAPSLAFTCTVPCSVQQENVSPSKQQPANIFLTPSIAIH